MRGETDAKALSPTLCFAYISEQKRDQITNEKSSKRDQIAFYLFYLFLVDVQTNAGHIRTSQV